LSGSLLADQQRLDPYIRRLRDVVAAVAVQVLAGRKSLDPMSRREFAPHGKRRQTSSAFLGVQPLAKNSSSLNEDARPPSAFVGVALPFGRMSADAFSSLADNAIGLGAREFRLTSWRAILIPAPTLDAARKLAARLPTSEFILRPEDPRRRVVACVGAPACLRGTTDVRTDATRVAAFVPDSATVHVSGCAKGCAHPRAAAATLVGRNGLYDLVSHGAPWDEPVRTGMSATEAAEQVRYLMEGIAA
jgi:sulfite reductase beta subunit-like hemoprotein